MIDLTRNQKAEIRNQKQQDEPVGLVILALLPFIAVMLVLATLYL